MKLNPAGDQSRVVLGPALFNIFSDVPEHYYLINGKSWEKNAEEMGFPVSVTVDRLGMASTVRGRMITSTHKWLSPDRLVLHWRQKL